MSSLDPMESEAADWVVREDRGLGLRERVAFDQWLSQDLAHRVCYLRLKSAWRRADRLSSVKGSWRAPRAVLGGRWLGSAQVKGAALAAGLAIAIGAAVTGFSHSGDQTFSTAAGQHRNLT